MSIIWDGGIGLFLLYLLYVHVEHQDWDNVLALSLYILLLWHVPWWVRYGLMYPVMALYATGSIGGNVVNYYTDS